MLVRSWESLMLMVLSNFYKGYSKLMCRRKGNLLRRYIATKVVDRLTLVDSAFVVPGEISDSGDTCYNYARVLCHYGSLVMEFRDAWGLGQGERMIRCWKLFMPHFQTAGRTKYSLAALNVLFQTNATLSPNAAHQVMWHRFVNSKGGMGNNIPCDLYNEHINKQISTLFRTWVLILPRHHFREQLVAYLPSTVSVQLLTSNLAFRMVQLHIQPDQMQKMSSK